MAGDSIAARRMTPAGQRLESGDIQRVAGELRLQAQFQLVAVERAAQVALHHAMFFERHHHRRIETLRGAAAAPFSRGSARCWRAGTRSPRRRRRADTARCPELAPRRTCWPRTAIGRASARGTWRARLMIAASSLGIVQEQQELVAAEPRRPRRGSATRSRSRLATSISTSSPPSWPRVSLMSWKPSRSNRISAATRAGAGLARRSVPGSAPPRASGWAGRSGGRDWSGTRCAPRPRGGR